MHWWQQKLEMFIRERRRSQEANCFPECQFKRLSQAASVSCVSPALQSARGRGCSLTHLSVLQLPSQSSVNQSRESIWLEKSMLNTLYKATCFSFQPELLLPSGRAHSCTNSCGGGAGAGGTAGGTGAPVEWELRPHQPLDIRLPHSPPAPSKDCSDSLTQEASRVIRNGLLL